MDGPFIITKHFTMRPLLLLVLFLLAGYRSGAQSAPDRADQAIALPDRLLAAFRQKSDALNQRLEKQAARYLDKMQRKEQRMRRQLMRVDSTAAKALFDDAQDQYTALAAKAKNVSEKDPGAVRGTYLPYLDSMQGALKFLGQQPGWQAKAGELARPLASVNRLQNNLHQSQEIQAFLRQRKEQIGAALKRYTQLPKGLTKGYGEINKQVYYYQAQVKEYKALLSDPAKREEQALALLRKLPAFQDFMQQHSLLAGLFPVPAGYGTPAALAGLQTRDQVQQAIAGRLGAGGPNAQAMLQQNLQAAQTQLHQLKDKLNQLGGGSSELDLPDFQPNTQKTKTFLQRLEYSTNLQTAKSNQFFPTTSDIGLNVGYKLNQKSVIGIGSSYKLGLGMGIRNIAFSHQGLGLRSFLDYRLKGSFWLTGGAEMNYRSRFDRFDALKDYSAWQRSALLGLSKKYQVSKKVKGNAQLLYDALWKQQTPRGQAILFRVGYAL